LVGALNSTGPYTVFAPINAPFDALGIISIDQENLTKVPLYYVITGETFSGKLNNATATTLNGQMVNITITMAGSVEDRETGNVTENTTGNVSEKVTALKDNNATIMISDMLCSNGVIQVIDQVLAPPTWTRAHRPRHIRPPSRPLRPHQNRGQNSQRRPPRRRVEREYLFIFHSIPRLAGRSF
jgi:uncharacterized surface protein with fasciclin (FAS1) repeats